MRAAVFVGTEQPLSIEDLEPAAPGPRDVVVEIGASGVCHLVQGATGPAD